VTASCPPTTIVANRTGSKMSVRIAEGIYFFTAEGDAMIHGWGANQGFIITSEGVVVVDTGFTRFRAEELKSEIRKITDYPIALVINTHDHSDHVFGNSVIASHDTPILSHERCNKNVSQYGLGRMKRYSSDMEAVKTALEGLDIIPSSDTYESDFSFDLGEKRFEIIHPNRGAHTFGDTMVFLPDDGVLFTGDVMWEKYHPNLEDANIQGWMVSLENISELRIRRVLPGHGTPTTKESMMEFHDYLLRFEVWMKSSFSDIKKPEDLVFNDTQSRDWKLKMIVKRNILILYERFKSDYSRGF